MSFFWKLPVKWIIAFAFWMAWSQPFPPMALAQSNATSPTSTSSVPTKDNGEKPPSALVVIPDEPRRIDPVTVLPSQLTSNVTVEFKAQPLKDIVKWLQTERSLNVVVDNAALEADAILLGEPFTDRSIESPLYLLLNRMKSLRLSWYFDDDTLYITSAIGAELHMSTIPYNVGDLLDAGFRPKSIVQTLTARTGGKWSLVNGEGAALIQLGDVIFVRATFEQHQAVSALLSALRKHGRRTLILDPVQHEVLRQKLTQKITVDFDERPLHEVISEISKLVSADIRLDSLALEQEGISEREPISMKMNDRPLEMILKSSLMNLKLTRVERDGVLWITTQTAAETEWKLAVFDVRDLCRNQNESKQLMQAIQVQTGGRWEMIDGEGGSQICPTPGILVVQQNQQMLDDVLKLLEKYREALLASKARKIEDSDPNEFLTRYYRMQKEIAEDLLSLLPVLVAPSSWKTVARQEANGTIHLVSSTTRLVDLGERGIGSAANSTEPRKQATFPIANSVLIIHQTRENHDVIAKMLDKIEHGEHPARGQSGAVDGGRFDDSTGGGMMGGGMGGGGFGGGFFSMPAE